MIKYILDTIIQKIGTYFHRYFMATFDNMVEPDESLGTKELSERYLPTFRRVVFYFTLSHLFTRMVIHFDGAKRHYAEMGPI